MNPEQQTRAWIEKFVIGLNLCPFAHAPFAADKIHYRMAQATEEDAIYTELVQEIADFALLPADRWETGLFIVPQGLEDFDTYLGVLEDAQAALSESGVEVLLQLASFHPDYRFEGAAEDDPANYSNRSPWPMFHLIRQDGLQVALECFPDPESIPVRNERLLRAMGEAGILELLAAAGVR